MCIRDSKDTASLIKREVSDGVIAPGFTDEALEILKAKKKGNYCVIKIDENYRPAPLEHKQVFGITFEQGRQELPIDDELLSNVVTENKEIPEAAKRDLKIALITLKYTQSNSVCFVKDGQAIGVGAGQQSRVHCTRLAGQKADNWFLRQCPKVLDLQFVDGIRRADRDNAIDVYIGEEYMDAVSYTHLEEPKAAAAADKIEEDGMYLFTTSTCPNCKMAKEMLAEEQYEVIDAERHPDLAAQYGIMQAPTLLVVEDGQAQKIVNASNIQKYVDEYLS